jgi:hypothetical protein
MNALQRTVAAALLTADDPDQAVANLDAAFELQKPSASKRYTQAVHRGLQICIADLETVIAEHEGEVALHRDEWTKDQVRQSQAWIEDAREAIEWIRVQRAKRGGAS